MIRTSIELQDNFSATIHRVIESVNLSVSAMDNLHQSVSNNVNLSNFDEIRHSINQAAIDVQNLDKAFRRISTERINPPEFNNVNWVSSNFEIFKGSGYDRLQQEISNANNLLNTMNQNQLKLSNTASKINILPNNMVTDINSISSRIEGIRDKIIELEKTPKVLFNESTNYQLESLRSKLVNILDEQQALNTAVENMDIETANREYLKLSNTINSAEIHIRDNMNGQDNFNRKIQEGQNQFNRLTSMIKGAVGAYLGISGAKIALNVSDTLTSTTARLNLMNDGLQTTSDLQNMIYLSAERSRGSYQSTADAVSKLGLMAGDAFKSSEEIIAFTEQLNKQFTIAGTEAAGISAAMLQLTQAMGSGILRGEEYNSILEQAPNIIGSIADYMNVSKGELKDMASEGRITAEVVKNAMFAAASDTNAKFNSMPKTFSQIATSIKNTALIAFQPILERLNSIANSQSFNILVQNIINGLSVLSNITLNIFGLLISVGGIIADNWSIISPIITGISVAMGLYTAAIIANNIVQGIGAMIRGVIALQTNVLAASTMMATGATFAQTVAQHGLNAALLACPITWIILGIVALIAVIFAVSNAIAKFTGIANSGFSLICGSINVVIQFFVNLFMVAANISIGIGGFIGALAHNMMTAFRNSIANIQSFFYNLLATSLKVIGSIAEQLNKLPFIKFDYSGITSKANEYANKAAELQVNKGEYKNIIHEFNKGFNTFDAFSDGWINDAFNKGTAFGDSIGNKITGIMDNFFDFNNVPDPNDYKNLGNYGDSLNNIGNTLEGIENGVKDTAGNTGSIKESLEVSEEDLKYLRDLAERDIVNRFTTAEISVNLGGITNTVNNEVDLDGIIDYVATGVIEAVEIATEGVHK